MAGGLAGQRGVAEARRQPGLAGEALDELLGARHLGAQHLDRDRSVQGGLQACEDGAHAALAEQRADLVATLKDGADQRSQLGLACAYGHHCISGRRTTSPANDRRPRPPVHDGAVVVEGPSVCVPQSSGVSGRPDGHQGHTASPTLCMDT